MALEKQGKIRITASAELGELQKLNDSIASMRDGFLKSVSAASLLNKGLGTAIGLVKEGVADLHSFSSAANVFRGNLESLRKATGGMASDLDLMQSYNKITTLGVKLSAEQFEQLYKNVAKVAPAMGIDMKQALESAATALSRQSTAVADNLGVVMKLEEVQKKYADSIGKTVQQLSASENRFAFEKEFMRALGETAEKTSRQTDTLTGSLKRFTNQVKNTILGVLDALNRAPQSYDAAIRKRMGEELAPVESDYMAGQWLSNYPRYGYSVPSATMTGTGAPRDLEALMLVEQGLASARKVDKLAGRYGKKKRGGGGGSGSAIWKQNTARAQSDLMGWINRTLAGQEERELGEFQRGSESRGRADDLRRMQAFRAEQEAAMEKQRAQDAEEEKVRDLIAIYSTYDQQLRQMAVGSVAQFAGGLWNIVDAAIMGGDSVGAALAKMLKSTMLAIATEATVKAVMATAEGIFALASIVRAGQAPAYFAAAGKFAAVAAIAGGVGLGMSAAGVGAQPSKGSAGSSAGSSYRPSFGQRQSAKDLPPIVVRVTFDRSDPASVEFAKRRVHAQMVAAGYQEAA